MCFRHAALACVLAMLQLTTVAHAQTFKAGGTEWRPFSYADAQGNLHGISTDIARRILDEADVPADFVSYPVNRLQAMLARGEVDINYADSPRWNSRQELSQYALSKPYMKVEEHLYFLKDHPARNTPVDKLPDLTIGIVRGYTYLILDNSFAENRLSKLETSRDSALLDLLQAGRVDAVAMVDELFNYLVSEQRLDRNAFAQGPRLSEAPIIMKIQPQYAHLLPRINAAIDNLVHSGEVARIRKAYLFSDTVALSGEQAKAINAP